MTAAGVLWVTDEVPDRHGGGGNHRQAELLLRLARTVPIDLLVAGEVRDDDVRAAARQVVEVDVDRYHFEKLPSIGRRGLATTLGLAGVPREMAMYSPVRAALGARIERAASDVETILVHHQSLAPLVRRRAPGTRWVLSLFHASEVRAAHEADVAHRARSQWLVQRDGANSARYERRHIDVADALVVTTRQDADRLARPGTPTYVVPQGIDLDRYPMLEQLTTDPVVIMTGSLDYTPNVDGAVHVARDIWPYVRRVVPSARLLVVGRAPRAAVRELHGRDGIEVHADVPGIAPFLARARVAVAPLRIGTGVRVKVLEAMAAGIPVVATTIAMEGIDAGPHEVAIADDPPLFAEATVRLLCDTALAHRRRTVARAFVVAAHDWSQSAAHLGHALRRPHPVRPLGDG